MRAIGKPAVIAVIIAVTLLFAITFSCSKDEKKTDVKKAVEKKPLPVKPEIAKVEIDPPEPTSSDFVRAVPVLTHPKMRFVKYTYRWFVNNEAVVGGDKRLLDKEEFKKGDSVYCLVKAVRGNYQSEEVESEKIVIANAPPVINLTPIPAFEVPGEFSYRINAVDPDGDALDYTLLEPKNSDIFLDPETGTISWNITEQMREEFEKRGKPVSSGSSEEEESASAPSTTERKERPEPAEKEKKPTPYVKIVFQVTDADGLSTTASISINLLKGREIAE
jgi:hypothetical protein